MNNSFGDETAPTSYKKAWAPTDNNDWKQVSTKASSETNYSYAAFAAIPSIDTINLGTSDVEDGPGLCATYDTNGASLGDVNTELFLVALGNLDEDEEASRFSIRLSFDADRDVVKSQLKVEDPLE